MDADGNSIAELDDLGSREAVLVADDGAFAPAALFAATYWDMARKYGMSQQTIATEFGKTQQSKVGWLVSQKDPYPTRSLIVFCTPASWSPSTGRRIGCVPPAAQRRVAPRPVPRGQTMTTSTCVTCGSPITVTTRNPNCRFCSPRCRVADWHAHHRGNDVVHGANDVQPRTDVPNAVPAANGVTKCPHCRHDLAVIAVVIPADAAHVQTPEVIT